jgi:hypothetical protein
MGLTRSGALLVRPDGHILSVAKSAADAGDVAHAVRDYTKTSNPVERVA